MNKNIEIVGFNQNKKVIFFRDKLKNNSIVARKVLVSIDNLFTSEGIKLYFRHNKRKYYINELEVITLC